MTQAEIANLFQTSKQNVSQHFTSLFNEKELNKNSVVKYFFATSTDGKEYNTAFYNLNAILAIGFRVHSKRGTLRKGENTKLADLNDALLNKLNATVTIRWHLVYCMIN